MKLTITIKMDNAAFEEAAGYEAARILKTLAGRIEDWPGANDFSMTLFDINGNKVGEAKGTK